VYFSCFFKSTSDCTVGCFLALSVIFIDSTIKTIIGFYFRQFYDAGQQYIAILRLVYVLIKNDLVKIPGCDKVN